MVTKIQIILTDESGLTELTFTGIKDFKYELTQDIKKHFDHLSFLPHLEHGVGKFKLECEFVDNTPDLMSDTKL